jgi:hypothetical protein
MERKEYSTTGTLRSEFPTLETTFGTLAHWQSLQFGEYGAIQLGGFEPPYTPESPGSDKSITINNVEYSGSVHVYLDRSGAMRLDFKSLHRAGDWRNGPTASAQTKLETELLPLAKELFPIPTRENIAAAIFQEMNRESFSYASSGVHKVSMRVYHDSRYADYADDIRAGIVAGLDRAKDEALKESFNVNTRY